MLAWRAAPGCGQGGAAGDWEQSEATLPRWDQRQKWKGDLLMWVLQPLCLPGEGVEGSSDPLSSSGNGKSQVHSRSHPPLERPQPFSTAWRCLIPVFHHGSADSKLMVLLLHSYCPKTFLTCRPSRKSIAGSQDTSPLLIQWLYGLCFCCNETQRSHPAP